MFEPSTGISTEIKPTRRQGLYLIFFLFFKKPMWSYLHFRQRLKMLWNLLSLHLTGEHGKVESWHECCHFWHPVSLLVWNTFRQCRNICKAYWEGYQIILLFIQWSISTSPLRLFCVLLTHLDFPTPFLCKMSPIKDFNLPSMLKQLCTISFFSNVNYSIHGWYSKP